MIHECKKWKPSHLRPMLCLGFFVFVFHSSLKFKNIKIYIENVNITPGTEFSELELSR